MRYVPPPPTARPVPAVCATVCACLALGAVASAGGAPPKRPGTSVTKPPAVKGGVAVAPDAPLTGAQKVVHALNRLGFGPRPGDVERVRTLGGVDAYVARQLAPETIDDRALDAKLARLGWLAAPPERLTRAFRERRAAQREQQRMLAAVSSSPPPPASTAAMMPSPVIDGVARAAAELQTAKVLRAVESERQLLEVLVDFWTNHFNVDIRKGPTRVFKVVDDRDVIRVHALGRFRDLLGASAHSPAMLVYLDNARSQVPRTVRSRPAKLATRGGVNENYARELMELHTLGVDGGGYTQKDVQEVARCFTGWGVDPVTGRFRFYPRRHDDGEKVVLGRRIPTNGGERDGEMVLDILAAHPSTARFVSRKLCRRFVSDEPPAALVERCAAVWIKTGGDLREVVRAVVTSPEFFGRAAYRQKVKSPFEFAVSSVRALGGTVAVSAPAARGLVGQVAALGQPLFQHQAPTGYPEDSRRWVSSGALIARLNFALALTDGRVAGVALDRASLPTPGGLAPDALAARIGDHLLHGDVSPATRATLCRQAVVTARDDPAALRRRVVALVLGSPEFQRR